MGSFAHGRKKDLQMQSVGIWTII